MEAEDPLSELADIHLPDAVPFWPPAPGWWVLAALVVLALVLLYRKQLARIFLRRRLAAAQRELDTAHAAFLAATQRGEDRNAAGLQLLQTFNAVLKRVALVHYSDPALPRLSGSAWLRFLDAQAGGTDFSDGPGRALGEGHYRPVFVADVDALLVLCRRWVQQAYLQPKPKPQAAAAPQAAANAGGAPR